MIEQQTKKSSQSGFTIIEIVIASLIFPILFIGVSSAFVTAQKIYTASKQLNEVYTVLSACPEIDRALEFSVVLDTHAGAGMYLIESDMARKTGEWSTGIGKLWEQADADLPESVQRYRQVVKAANASPALKHYPGSPWISGYCTRHADVLRFFERHSTDAPLLAQALRFVQKRTQINVADGLAGLKALMPPPQRRAAVLIDPSYEDKTDYGKVVASLKDAVQRFATGTYVLWYPILARREAVELPDRLVKLGLSSWLHVTLSTQPTATDGLGMTGSGLFIVNPPWTLPQTLEDTLPWLSETLGEAGHGDFTLDWQIP